MVFVHDTIKGMAVTNNTTKGQDMTHQNPTYWLSTTDFSQNGRTFDSLADAKKTADRLSNSRPNTAYDVCAFVDRGSFRLVYTPATCRAGKAHRGAYVK